MAFCSSRQPLGPAFHGASRSTHIFKRMDNLGAFPSTVKWLQTNDLSRYLNRISAEHFGGLPGSVRAAGPARTKRPARGYACGSPSRRQSGSATSESEG